VKPSAGDPVVSRKSSPPRRHLTHHCGALSSHTGLRSRVVPQAEVEESATEKSEKPARKSKYIPWAELLRRTFGFEIVCQKCQAPRRLIALVKNQAVAARLLVAMHLPAEAPELHPCARPNQRGERETTVGRPNEEPIEARRPPSCRA
jgi:hypothetical protein